MPRVGQVLTLKAVSWIAELIQSAKQRRAVLTLVRRYHYSQLQHSPKRYTIPQLENSEATASEIAQTSRITLFPILGFISHFRVIVKGSL